jgi:hypothetical protein
MIASANDIRQVRAVASNIGDEARINTYILEVEQLQVAPAIGVRLYEALDSGASALTEAQQGILLNGGYYTAPDGERAHCGGVKRASAYLAYARLLHNNQLSVTAFGNVSKKGEFSAPSDDEQVTYSANQAKKVGLAYLNTCVDYVKSIGAPGKVVKAAAVTFKAVGL